MIFDQYTKYGSELLNTEKILSEMISNLRDIRIFIRRSMLCLTIHDVENRPCVSFKYISNVRQFACLKHSFFSSILTNWPQSMLTKLVH